MNQESLPSTGKKVTVAIPEPTFGIGQEVRVLKDGQWVEGFIGLTYGCEFIVVDGTFLFGSYTYMVHLIDDTFIQLKGYEIYLPGERDTAH